MYFPLMNWVTTALTVSHGVPLPHLNAHDMTSELRQVAPVSPSVASQSPSASITATTFDWSRAPSTRARVFAERLADVRPVCVRGSRNDAENCLLDLPADTDVDVSASRLMLAGCEASLPAPMRAALSTQGRDTRALEQAFSETFAAESEGKFSVSSIEGRLTQRLSQMSPDIQRMLRHPDTYIEVPQLAFLRVLTGEHEARRHHIAGPFPDTHMRRSTGNPEVRDAMLGAYISTPVNGRLRTLFVSLATPTTVQRVFQGTLTHAGRHVPHLFGEIPESYMTTRMQMRAVGPGSDIVHTLAELLHDGHRRYGEFARGETREALAPESHRHVRQPSCRPGLAAQPSPATQLPPSAPSTSPSEGQPQASAAPARASSRSRIRRDPPSAAEMQQALAELERLDQEYSKLSRPRYG
ncbi:hypothetical protein PHO31112_03087 [Pandoraea horticolens]|uniref:Uncharacterized protein n=1 Tax=Pandoraea horticolens TaxID=2508298 RepID=A0A5E4WA60_9BURK|nr:hypothetical protein [Pandoraea horticolens]VVE20170.1 hypothetical protein PHO31112_03087 [Pandoraea horticolens]